MTSMRTFVEYARRILDDTLDQLLPTLPALALQGAKGVGKTATAMQRATTSLRLDDARQRELYEADPDRLRHLDPAVLLDEWPRLPEVRDHVRRAVDDGAEPGTFLLAGSAAPTGATIHSGAGRIIDLRMRPLSLAERGLETPTVSLRTLLRGDRPALAGSTAVDLEGYVDEILRSGFPGIRDLPDRARTVQLDSYLANIAAREFAEQGAVLRRPETLRSWLAAYAAATSTTAGYSTILDAATAGLSGKPSKDTTITYRDVLAQLWLLDPIPPWQPSDNRLQRLARAPKHQLADPALAARLQRDRRHDRLRRLPAPGRHRRRPRGPAGPLTRANRAVGWQCQPTHPVGALERQGVEFTRPSQRRRSAGARRARGPRRAPADPCARSRRDRRNRS